ncbi:hypothetical protein KsCSTR_14330 [Candidatus Kuenenia stuttgartiensis]|uniref:Uncharacterized protein n=1 Tax=Kuenenia stuttgartiensis TaxID=174633 RepID=Q1Q1A3_KUEST|nr:hypothetical protein KsCSTR_14330 [Candidatus Kuenenia stuttgartiensis]CAJ73783.1 unknown protein [Candidatus Kuenenia stuttgartiensis]
MPIHFYISRNITIIITFYGILFKIFSQKMPHPGLIFPIKALIYKEKGIKLLPCKNFFFWWWLCGDSLF